MTRDTEFGVVEMGASACGEIALLCSIAEPNYGLITNIGRAHLDGFGGPEGVRRGKGRAVRLPGRERRLRAFVCRDDDVLTPMAAERDPLAAEYYPRDPRRGHAAPARRRIQPLQHRRRRSRGPLLRHRRGAHTRHAVAGYVPDNHRSQRIETPHNTVLADCYNANPSSMRAAIGHFRTESAGTHTQKALILGDMLELGDWAQAEHEAILRLALDEPATQLPCSWGGIRRGRRQRAPRSGCRRGRGAHPLLPSREALEADLAARPLTDALVLVRDRTACASTNSWAYSEWHRTDDRRAPECSGARFHVRSHRCRNPCAMPHVRPQHASGPGPPPPASTRPATHDTARPRTHRSTTAAGTAPKDRQQTEDKRTERKQAAVLRRTAERMDARSASGRARNPMRKPKSWHFVFSLNLSVVQSKRDP